MVCLSLCQKNSSEAAAELYSSRASKSEKISRFGGLLTSQDQHAGLLDSLYEELKAVGDDAAQRGATCEEAIQRKREKVRLLKEHSKTQQGEIIKLQQTLKDMDQQFAQRADALSRRCNARIAELDAQLSKLASERARLGGGNRLGAAGGPIAVVGGLPQAAEDPELSRLRGEIEATSEMANKRIDHVNSSILTLKKQIKEAQSEVREAQVQNEALAKRGRELTKTEAKSTADERMKASVREQEAAKLRREISILGTQKQSLMDILDDLYGAQPAMEEDPNG